MNICVIGSEGYCGSYLANLLQVHGHKINRIDLKLGRNFWDQFIGDEVILWFAGATSVREAEQDPERAYLDNVVGLQDLAMRYPGQYLIYASSASVYDGVKGYGREIEHIRPDRNVYDKTKFAADYVLSSFFPNTLGLRMGTVYGFGANMRRDTFVNAMQISAMERDEVLLSNPGARRTVLSLERLGNIVLRAIESRPTGLMNAGSANITIGDMAEWVSKYHRVPVRRTTGSAGYSFEMDLSRMGNLLREEPTPLYLSDFFKQEMENFKNAYNSSR